ncbi:hypothetical protein [Streptomyces roseolus]|uniref:hypothetical protein n=1 Tax=Streptomyces roseolus TaxID=67358 RepID=UPI00167832EB|nr:hypothetical protein [Streptomyces roseolus]GGR65175.1 hypothetical protein GCM10010282_67670 [Streptomyces roseolus]
MGNPQQPEQRRSGRGAGTPQDSASLKADEAKEPRRSRGRPHGTDKGERGGGEGGGTPPDQREAPEAGA